MRRREFITLLGGAAATWPLVARAQQAMPVIGLLNFASPDEFEDRMRAFRQGLKDTGYVEGENVALEYLWANNHIERLPALAADLVDRRVAVIVATGGRPVVLAAKAATATIPIVFTTGGDPVKLGLVASMNRPGGNATGISVLTTTLEAKRLELLHQIVPRASTVAVVVNSKSPATQTLEAEARAAAQALGVRVEVLGASTEDEIDAAFVIAVQRGAGALLVAGDAFFNSRHAQFTALAARHKLPAIYDRREIAMADGLMSYGMNYIDIYRQAGI